MRLNPEVNKISQTRSSWLIFVIAMIQAALRDLPLVDWVRNPGQSFVLEVRVEVADCPVSYLWR